MRGFWKKAVLLLAAGAAGGAIVTKLLERSTPAIVMAQGRTGSPTLSSGFSAVVEHAAPAVVNVFSQRVVEQADGGAPLAPFLDPFFRDFFGNGGSPFSQPRERIERSLGSGVVVSNDGYVLTNNHVVEGADQVRIATAAGKELDAKVVGTDPKTDIAVVKVEGQSLPVIPIADSSQVKVGDFALAIGNPFGIGQTVTQGIVSATGRGELGITAYEDFIQTDAAINRGNSGGALTNARGELIGINTAILSPTGGFQGVGFAVPINMARAVMDQIVKHGRVVRGWMGVSIQEVTPEIAKAFGLKGDSGVLIGDVAANSPAAQAGLERGDVVLQVNGNPVNDVRNLQLKIASMQPGTEVRLQVMRDGQAREVSLKLGEAPAEAGPGRQPGGGEPGGGMIGLSVQDLTPEIAKELELPAGTQGVVVAEVAPGSPAAMAGLARGDVIQQVNRKPVSSASEFASLVKQAGGEPILMLVNRRGSTRFVVVEPAPQRK
jgi:serine protease Do